MYEKTVRMPKAMLQSWTAALRSGEYTQGSGRLCSVSDDGVESYCCLGVLQQITSGEVEKEGEDAALLPSGEWCSGVGITIRDDTGEDFHTPYKHDEVDFMLYDLIETSGNTSGTIAALNDGKPDYNGGFKREPMPFVKIADVLEQIVETY